MSNCLNCIDNYWIQNAKNYCSNLYINDPKRIAVEYLLNNDHCGKDNGARMNDIVDYINSNLNKNYSREEFQQQVLNELKREGIVATLIYPGRKGGVFIPCSLEDIKESCSQLLTRVVSELSNLEGILEKTKYFDSIKALRIISNFIKDNL